MKIFKLLSLLPVMILLTSCMGEEPNNIGYIAALGIDKADDGYIYTIQFANPTKISGGASEEGGSGGNIVENISVQAPTIYAAINNANMITSKTLSLSHAQIIVVSEEVAKNEMKEINDVFARNNDIRPDIYYAIAEDAGKYLEEVKPIIELNPVKYYNLTYNKKHGGAVPQVIAAEFYMESEAKTSDCPLPFAGVAKSEEENKEDTDAGSKGGEEQNKAIENQSNNEAEISKNGFENKNKNYIAGEVGKKVKNKSEAAGMAVFKDYKYIGKLGSADSEIYNILTGKMEYNNITFYSEKNPQHPITVRVEQKKNPEYKIDFENKKVEIYIEMENDLLSAPAEYKNENTIEEMNKQTSEMITKKASDFINMMYNRNGVDILGIKGKIRKYFTVLDDYSTYCENFNAKEWDFSVYTDFEMKRTGMTYYR